MNLRHDKLSSPTNPNGVFEDFVDGSMKERFQDPQERLIIATADVKSFLVEIAGLDPDMAEVVAARATQEVAHALNTNINDSDLAKCIEAGSKLSEKVAVDRAVANILDQT